jgi:hypothetical protein
MIPELVTGEWRKWIGGVTNETSSSVGVHSEKERNEEMMCVPESLERLLANLGVGSGVHEKHAEQHNMSRDSTCFGVVDLNGSDWSNLSLLDVEEAAVVSIFIIERGKPPPGGRGGVYLT